MGTPEKVQRSQMWYAGVVKNVQGMKYDVKYNDGSFEQGIPAEYVRRETGGNDVLPGVKGSPDIAAREDPDEEAFKEKIMAQLEENAFKVEEAHNILTLQFGTRAGDAVKDAVLEEWLVARPSALAALSALCLPASSSPLPRTASWADGMVRSINSRCCCYRYCCICLPQRAGLRKSAAPETRSSGLWWRCPRASASLR